MNQFEMSPRAVQVSLKVREACKSCKRYGKKNTCPPHVESVEYYQRLLPLYKNCRIFYDQYSVTVSNVESSRSIEAAVRAFERKLREDGHYFILCFGAGSCKMCDSCPPICPAPEKSLMPLEAAGIVVVHLMLWAKVKISFPVVDSYYRVGAVFYD